MEELNKHVKRPVLLNVISVFSFISIGFGLLNSILLLLMGRLSTEELELARVQNAEIIESMSNSGMDGVATLLDQLNRIQEGINSNVYVYALFLLGAYTLGLIGVIYMRRGFKKGFHFFISYCLMVVVSIYLCLPPNDVPAYYIITSLIPAGLFVFLYGLNLKWFYR